MKKIIAFLFLSIPSITANDNSSSWRIKNIDIESVARETAVAYCYFAAMSAVVIACERHDIWYSPIFPLSTIAPILLTAHAIKHKSTPLINAPALVKILFGLANGLLGAGQIHCLLTQHIPNFVSPKGIHERSFASLLGIDQQDFATLAAVDEKKYAALVQINKQTFPTLSESDKESLNTLKITAPNSFITLLRLDTIKKRDNRSFQGREILHHFASIPCSAYVAYANIKAGIEELVKAFKNKKNDVAVNAVT